MNIFLKFFLPLAFCLFAFEGTGQVTFLKYIHGDYNNWTLFEPTDIKQTADNGYIITGVCSENYLFRSIFLMSTNQIGDTNWIKYFNMPGNYLRSYHVEILNDGFIIAGRKVDSLTNNFQHMLMKTDFNGEAIWTNFYNNNVESITGSTMLHILKTSDGGFLLKANDRIASTNNYELMLLKTDDFGNIEWQKRYPAITSNLDDSEIIEVDEKYVTCNDNSLIQFDNFGEIEWLKEFKHQFNDQSQNFKLSCISKVNDGFFLTGTYYYDEDNYLPFLVKVNQNGEIEFSKSIVLPGFSKITSQATTEDGGAIICYSRTDIGSNWRNGGFLKFDSFGNGQFRSSYSSQFDADDIRAVIEPTLDQGFVSICYGADNEENNGRNFIKVDSTGSSDCNFLHIVQDDTVTISFIPISFSTSLTNNFVQSSSFLESKRSLGCVIETFCVDIVSLEENQLENGFEIFPNPFTSEAKIVFNIPQTNTKIQLLDVLGKELQSVSFSGMEYIIYRESLSASMYFVQITNQNNQSSIRKVILE